ncbi:hypothetical protein P8918_13720 [Bacillus spizizenii]|nr:hypothetical protein [Bacillus spizizenii]MCY8890363.1 hypothetical protein [Bacillus spizizenii]MEC0842087.1 hypothetical protein [Bacillus spizizenii]
MHNHLPQPEGVEITAELNMAVKRYSDNCILVQKVEDVGTQLVFRFENNNGASLAVLDSPESGYSEYELVVIRFEPDKEEWLTYPENGIVDHGLARNLSPVDITNLLEQIKGL